MIDDTDAALERGRQLYAHMAEHTEKMFARKRCLIDYPKVSVWAAELCSEDDYNAIDFELYQSFIDKMDSTKPLVFATLNRTRMSSGLWTVGLRRASDALHVGTIAQQLGECSELAFKTGGGHPYAAGAQCYDFDLSTERICKQIADICTDILIEDDEHHTIERLYTDRILYKPAILDSYQHPSLLNPRIICCAMCMLLSGLFFLGAVPMHHISTFQAEL